MANGESSSRRPKTKGTAVKPSSIGAIALGLAMASILALPARGQEKKEVELSDCPEAVQKTFRLEARGAKVVEVVRETEDGKTTFWGGAEIGGKMYAIGVDPGGTLTEMGLEVGDDQVAFDTCPAPVRKTFQEETRGAKIGLVAKGVRYGTTTYEASSLVGGKIYDIAVAEDGTLIEKALVIEEDGIGLQDCPAAVQKAFKEEARGGEIGEVTRSSGIGTPVFEAEVAVDGKHYFLEIADNGALISKMLNETP
jgi:hypothetical protein